MRQIRLSTAITTICIVAQAWAGVAGAQRAPRVSTLIRQLSSPDLKTRISATYSLSELGAAAEPAVSRGIRVVQLRLGIVLTPAGGALPRRLCGDVRLES